MRELGKYLLIQMIIVLMAAMLVADAFGQNKTVKADYKFTGEKTRLEVQFPEQVPYGIVEDWEDNTVVLRLPGMRFDDQSRSTLASIRNYIVKNVVVSADKEGDELRVETAQPFKIHSFSKRNGTRLYLDIYLSADPPGYTTLMNRANAYEQRGELTKAQRLYQKARAVNPESVEVPKNLSRLSAVLIGEDEGGWTGNDRKSINTTGSGSEMPSDLPGTSQKSERDNDAALSHREKAGREKDNPGFRAADAVGAHLSDGKSMSSVADSEKPEKNDDDKPETQAEFSPQYPGSGSSDNSSQQIVEKPASNGTLPEVMMLGIQDVLRKSGTETPILIVLYVIAGILAVTVVMLIRKLLTLYRVSYKKRRGKLRSVVSKKTVRKTAQANKASLVSEAQMQDVRDFAKKLSQQYAKAEAGRNASPETLSKRARPIILDDHTKHVEESLNELDAHVPDSEAVRLTKKFREKNFRQNTSGDKYEAIKHLREQKWEIWEIARELSMGTEEVKMALGINPERENSPSKGALYGQIYRMADRNRSVSDIATTLVIGEEEVNLALALRKSNNSPA